MAAWSSPTSGSGAGTTRQGKGATLMAAADRTGLPVAVSVGRAAPHEATLIETALEACGVEARPERLVGDTADERDLLRSLCYSSG